MKSAVFSIVFFVAASLAVPQIADARTRRTTNRGQSRARVSSRQKAPARYRAPARQKAPARYRAPARQKTPTRYRAPARHRTPTRYRAPARHRTPTRYRAPVRNHRLPRTHWRYRHFSSGVYYSAPAQVLLSNSQSFGITVQVLAGSSPVCSANPLVANQWLAPGASVLVQTPGDYVCYRTVSADGASAWIQQVVNAASVRFWL